MTSVLILEILKLKITSFHNHLIHAFTASVAAIIYIPNSFYNHHTPLKPLNLHTYIYYSPLNMSDHFDIDSKARAPKMTLAFEGILLPLTYTS